MELNFRRGLAKESFSLLVPLLTPWSWCTLCWVRNCLESSRGGEANPKILTSQLLSWPLRLKNPAAPPGCKVKGAFNSIFSLLTKMLEKA